jgi:hypothetical protein
MNQCLHRELTVSSSHELIASSPRDATLRSTPASLVCMRPTRIRTNRAPTQPCPSPYVEGRTAPSPPSTAAPVPMFARVWGGGSVKVDPLYAHPFSAHRAESCLLRRQRARHLPAGSTCRLDLQPDCDRIAQTAKSSVFGARGEEAASFLRVASLALPMPLSEKDPREESRVSLRRNHEEAAEAAAPDPRVLLPEPRSLCCPPEEDDALVDDSMISVAARRHVM